MRLCEHESFSVATICNFDPQAFFFINQSLRNPFSWDDPWLAIRNFWIPLYSIMVGYLLFKLKWKEHHCSASAESFIYRSTASSIIKARQWMKRFTAVQTTPWFHLMFTCSLDCGSGLVLFLTCRESFWCAALFGLWFWETDWKGAHGSNHLAITRFCFAQVYVGSALTVDCSCRPIGGHWSELVPERFAMRF